jgi:hypothetical protein
MEFYRTRDYNNEIFAAGKLNCTALYRIANSVFCSVYSYLVWENSRVQNSTRTIRQTTLDLSSGPLDFALLLGLFCDVSSTYLHIEWDKWGRSQFWG